MCTAYLILTERDTVPRSGVRTINDCNGRQGPEKKFSEWPAEFSVYSRDKYKNFLLTKFLKILQNAHAHQQFRQ